MTSSSSSPELVDGDGTGSGQMLDPTIQSLMVASQSWSKFDLTNRRPQLEKVASQTKEQRDASQASRKNLATATKQFKKSVKATEVAASSFRSDDNEATSPAVSTLMTSIDVLSKECRTIVKAYQEEIDNLTRRCKASDSAFLDLFKALNDLPDPSSTMSTAMEHLESKTGQVQHLLKGMEEIHGEMESIEARHAEVLKSKDLEFEDLKDQVQEEKKRNVELKNLIREIEKEKSSDGDRNRAEKEELIELRREVKEYELEFKGLKNQDITIQKLNAKIEDMERENEIELQRELKKAQEVLAQTEGRRAAEALEREAAMERRLQSVEMQLRAERAGREATQAHLLEADEGASEREAAWEAQRQILVDDADRLRENLQIVTRERDELGLKVSALRMEDDEDGVGVGSNEDVGISGSSGGGGGRNDVSSTKLAELALERKAYQAEVSELSLTVTSLREDIRNKDETMLELQSSMQATIESLEFEHSNLSTKVKALEAEIASAPSKESINNMKKELRILKKLEYNAVDADVDNEPEKTTSYGGDDADEDENLESVLISKLRKVEGELLKERREKANQLQKCEELRDKLELVQKEKADVDALASRLEADLERAISAAPVTLTSSAGGKNMELPVNTSSDPATLQNILNSSEPAPVIEKNNGKPSTSATEKANDDHSVATIVMAQRDRLRARCDALEAERDSFKRELQVQVSTSESLKADNTKLYEKVRYLQNYNNNTESSSGGRAYLRNKSNLADHDLDLEALEQRYEASVDPFRQFNRAERQRKMKEMSPMERIVFVVARTVLGSKEMRTFLFFYVSGMHLLVFFTTYHWSHEKGCDSLHHHQDLKHFHGGPPLEGFGNNSVVG